MDAPQSADSVAVDTTVERIERTTVKLPFRETPRRHLQGLLNWRYLHLVEVELASGHVGQGEAIRYYWVHEGVSDSELAAARGRDAARAIWDDDLSIGIQTALFDAVGRALGVPVHALLGDRVRDRVPIAWWCTKMPPEDLAAEAERAIDAGYTHVKMKGRPWYDIREQLDAIADVLPETASVNVDFNYTLQDVERAPEVLDAIVDTPQLDVVESPLHADDLAGARALRNTYGDRIDFARHYGRPTEAEALCGGVTDGMICHDHPRAATRMGDACTAAGLDATFQLTGSHVTGAFAVHLAAVHESAGWPIVTCQNVYADSLLRTDLPVADGGVPVPDEPGLGVRLHPDAVAEYAVEEPDERPETPILVEITWPDGRTMYFDGSLQVQWDDEIPYHEPGVTARIVPEDEDGWEELHERATEEGPFFA